MDNIIEEYNTLKNRMKELSVLIKKNRDKEYNKKEKNRITCDLCNISICKSGYEIHLNTKKHKLLFFESQKKN